MERKDYHILIVEDEVFVADVLAEMLEDLGYTIVGMAMNYAEAKQAIQEAQSLDLAIFDINLNDSKDGIDLATELMGEIDFPFVYLTSYSDSETISRASETNPEAYLIKPFKKEDVLAMIEIIRARKNNSNKAVVLQDEHIKHKVFISDIVYLESDLNYVNVHTVSKTFKVRSRLEELIVEYGQDHFIRTHQSYAVNMNKIDAVNGHYVLAEQTQVPISRKYKEAVLIAFGG